MELEKYSHKDLEENNFKCINCKKERDSIYDADTDLEGNFTITCIHCKTVYHEKITPYKVVLEKSKIFQESIVDANNCINKILFKIKWFLYNVRL